MSDQRAEYFRGLEESDRPRAYFRGADAEDDRKQWLFEVVEDNGDRVAIKQVEAESSGVTHRYWWRHLEDNHGFLTDQPLDRWDAGAVSEVSREEFQRVWDS
jgi:hypothetical protein